MSFSACTVGIKNAMSRLTDIQQPSATKIPKDLNCSILRAWR